MGGGEPDVQADHHVKQQETFLVRSRDAAIGQGHFFPSFLILSEALGSFLFCFCCGFDSGKASSYWPSIIASPLKIQRLSPQLFFGDDCIGFRSVNAA